MREHIKAVEPAVEHIAFIRRLLEVMGEDADEFDKGLDELCIKYHDKYAEMDEFALAIKGLADIIKSGHCEEFLADLANSFKE
jgi:hypothetical protein